MRSYLSLGLLLLACSDGSSDSGLPPPIRYPNHVSAGGSLPPAAEMTNPFSDSASVSDGAKIFSTMNCDGCHGGGALGWVGPSLVDGRWRYGGSDGAIYQSIFYGRPRGMPAYGGVMSPGAIWKVVTYIRAQPVPSVVPTQRWPIRETRPAPAREQTP
ncbi:MAG TPA: c-type cytochrome [Gemmatimonadales bacterium]|nr:c-type cytochrome [Gemmatimonadales bacterium]